MHGNNEKRLVPVCVNEIDEILFQSLRNCSGISARITEGTLNLAAICGEQTIVK